MAWQNVTIQDLGSVDELVAALATVATLAYLALQIRQHTRQLRDNARALRPTRCRRGPALELREVTW